MRNFGGVSTQITSSSRKGFKQSTAASEHIMDTEGMRAATDSV